jgi:hypothetical protein
MEQLCVGTGRTWGIYGTAFSDSCEAYFYSSYTVVTSNSSSGEILQL